MSPHSETEFERLLVAHGNRELSSADACRLQELASEDASRAREVREIEVLHGVLDDERALFREAMAPLDPREEADEVLQGLRRRAARAERALRDLAADVEPRPPLFEPTRRRSVAPAWWVAAAAAAAAVLWLVFGAGVFDSAAPPSDQRLRGGPGIVLRPEISAASREISWHAVVGARSYDATISDADDRIVLARPDEASRSYVWQFTPEEYDTLARHPGPLYLRIVARDGVGIRIDTSGDLPLIVR